MTEPPILLAQTDNIMQVGEFVGAVIMGGVAVLASYLMNRRTTATMVKKSDALKADTEKTLAEGEQKVSETVEKAFAEVLLTRLTEMDDRIKEGATVTKRLEEALEAEKALRRTSDTERAALAKTVEAQNEQLKQLRTDIDRLNKDNVKLETERDAFKQEVAKMQDTVHKLEVTTAAYELIWGRFDIHVTPKATGDTGPLQTKQTEMQSGAIAAPAKVPTVVPRTLSPS